jgi:superfamily II DNA or RNA helicase
MKTIISQPFMKNVKIAYGMTGTIPPKNTINYFCLKSLIGATIQVIKPYELMEQGYISKVHINQIRIHYKDKLFVKECYMTCAEYAVSDFVTEPDPKKPGKTKRVELENPIHQLKYAKTIPQGLLEIKAKIFNGPIDRNDLMYEEKLNRYLKELKAFIADSKNSNALVVERYVTHFMEARINYLCDKILPICTNNTLILGHHTTYLNYLTNIITKRFPQRHVVIITGAISSKKRDEIKQLLKENNDCILIASYGVMSTGITISNLCFGVLLESFKSNVINMQSIGRGLGLKSNASEYILYDLIDVFDSKILTNKIFLQGNKKIEIYEENHYPYRIINVNI